jgi:hypothetical protein
VTFWGVLAMAKTDHPQRNIRKWPRSKVTYVASADIDLK